MAWVVKGTDLKMCRGDYGLQLPVIISGTDFTANDVVRFNFVSRENGKTVLTKEYTPVEGVCNLAFTDVESALFFPGINRYVYSMDWYQDGEFMCNLIPTANFEVVNKA